MSTTKSKVSLVINNLIWIILNFLLFVTPLIFSRSTKEAFEFPKMFFVYFAGGLIIFLFLLRVIWIRQKFNFGSKFLLGFVGISFVSTIFSSHLYTSVWGYYSRFNDGLVSIVIFYGIYVAAVNTFSYEKLKKLFIPIALSGTIVSLYALIQHFQINTGTKQIVRIYSTLGQANWLAAVLVMIIPIILSKYLTERNKRGVFWFVSGILVLSGIWVSYSISGLLALIAVLVSFVCLNWELVKKNLYKFSVLFVFFAFFMLSQPGIFTERVQDVFTQIKEIGYRHTHVLAADEDTKINVSDSGSIRAGLAKGTWKIITENPKNFIIGTGLETFPYEFQKHRPAELNYTSEWDFILNKPHNYYLEIWAETGILGLLIYFGIVCELLKSRDKVLVPAFVGFFVANLFGWPTVSTALLFWVYFAVIESKKS